jgi:histidyl-tRNA synthetase
MPLDWDDATDDAGDRAMPTNDGPSDRGLRSSGMRDLGPENMERFRRAERAFLEVCTRHGYREIRTPALEPLHLYTATGSLSPQLLDGVYSFLDWDGWSGERVVLRPDSTVPAARWYEEQHDGDGPARLCYVQPVYRFAPEGDREIWQCGVELFGLGAPDGDVELLTLAREFIEAAVAGEVRVEIGHAGLVRAVLAAAGLDHGEQVEAYDRLLSGEGRLAGELAERSPESATALQMLVDLDGGSAAEPGNLRAALLPIAPEAVGPLDELIAVAGALEEAGVSPAIQPAGAGSFEYYSGLTFRLSVNDEPLVTGGRYDGLTSALGDRDVPASGFGADLLRIADLAGGRAEATQ